MPRKDPLSHLARHRGELPDTLVDEIEARLPAELPRVLALATDPAALRGEEPAATLARHAASILGLRHEPEAHAALLDLFDRAPLHTRLHEAAIRALAVVAPLVLEPLFARLDGPRGEAALEALVLGDVRDDRVVERIAAALNSADPRQGVVLARVAGDRRLLPPLLRLVDRILEAPPSEELALLIPALEAFGEMGAPVGVIGRVKARLNEIIALQER